MDEELYGREMTAKRKWIFGVAAAVIIAAALLISFRLSDRIPSWVTWNETSFSKNGLSYVLEDKRAVVTGPSGFFWQSDEKYKVSDILVCDINRDQKDELLLLCWKRGRFGSSKPFWVEKDENTWSQHIFIYYPREKDFYPLWMASDIGMDLIKWEFDEKERLILHDRKGNVTRWDYIGWGLEFIG